MKYKYLKTVLFIGLFIFSILKVYYSILVGSYGSTLAEVKTETEAIKIENANTELEIKNTYSLTKMSLMAYELGFGETSNIIYITSDNPIAGL